MTLTTVAIEFAACIAANKSPAECASGTQVPNPSAHGTHEPSPSAHAPRRSAHENGEARNGTAIVACAHARAPHPRGPRPPGEDAARARGSSCEDAVTVAPAPADCTAANPSRVDWARDKNGPNPRAHGIQDANPSAHRTQAVPTKGTHAPIPRAHRTHAPRSTTKTLIASVMVNSDQ